MLLLTVRNEMEEPCNSPREHTISLHSIDMLRSSEHRRSYFARCDTLFIKNTYERFGLKNYTRQMIRTGRGCLLIAAVASMLLPAAHGEEIGDVRTKFKVLGANDRIVVEAFDDPDVQGATCYLSRAKTGGISGSIGLAEDTSDASLACRQTGKIVLPENVRSGKEDGSQVFRKSTSILFKTMQVVRFYDKKRNCLVYLTYSNKIIEGSPKNSISAIPIIDWK